MARKLKRGDRVICARPKASPHPGRRAKEVRPAPHGEDYRYMVDKFWRVAQVRADGKVVLRTRRGKRHVLDMDDRLLRRARWWERLIYRSRFPAPAGPEADEGPVPGRADEQAGREGPATKPDDDGHP
jgi:hypothetical protein